MVTCTCGMSNCTNQGHEPKILIPKKEKKMGVKQCFGCMILYIFYSSMLDCFVTRILAFLLIAKE